MFDLSEKIAEFIEFFDSGAANSAAATFSEILHHFLQDVYPLAPQESPNPSIWSILRA